MKILSIETSCDETAVSIIEAQGGLDKLTFKVLSNLVLSQIKIHEKYGGVFPSLAKREHSKNLIPLVQKALEEAGLIEKLADTSSGKNAIDVQVIEKIKADLSHEQELFAAIIEFLESHSVPQIDQIAVTFGPGLEPALWVGINGAKVLGEVWKVPVMPVNHMEGHISSVLLEKGGADQSVESSQMVQFPSLALLISGGHTELVHIPTWLEYRVVGETRDDAVGEAFDKVARMLGLPYPGGPQISALAEQARQEYKNQASHGGQMNAQNPYSFPRPMLKSGDLNFSFSGLKTSVLYTIRDIKNSGAELTGETKKQIALAFEDAVVETLVAKTKKAIQEYKPKTLIIAGGVIANKTIRKAFEKLVEEVGANVDGEVPGEDLKLLIPTHALATDNALMIALAAYIRYSKNKSADYSVSDFKAEGNVKLSN